MIRSVRSSDLSQLVARITSLAMVSEIRAAVHDFFTSSDFDIPEDPSA